MANFDVRGEVKDMKARMKVIILMIPCGQIFIKPFRLWWERKEKGMHWVKEKNQQSTLAIFLALGKTYAMPECE